MGFARQTEHLSLPPTDFQLGGSGYQWYPPTDLEEVVGGITVDPSGRSQDPWGILETVLPVCGPLVSYVPDGDYSDRTNPRRPVCSTL